MSELYSLKDVAELFAVQEARLRYWAQTGFVGPSVRRGARVYYTFEDLIGVRAAKELTDRGLPMQRVRKQLEALRAALPGVTQPLAKLRVCSDGEDVVVVDEDVAWQPATGQVVMSFVVGSITSRPVAATPVRPSPPALPSTAWSCFQQGIDERDPARAEALFRRAVELDPGCAAAWTNLGNVLEARGARGDAREAYERALALEPELPEARYNLANLLSDVGEHELALGEYRRVLATAPHFADAHYNLAVLLERIGAINQARQHYLEYCKLDPASDWAARARARLAT